MTTTEPKTTENYVRWLKDEVNGARRLLISVGTKAGTVERVYEVEVTPTGYRLHFLDDANRFKVYSVNTNWCDGWRCDCPDATNRRDREYNCKHVRGLRAALAKRPYPETL